MDLTDVTVDIGFNPAHRPDLDRLVAGMTFADWHDVTMWFPVAEAIPGS